MAVAAQTGTDTPEPTQTDQPTDAPDETEAPDNGTDDGDETETPDETPDDGTDDGNETETPDDATADRVHVVLDGAPDGLQSYTVTVEVATGRTPRLTTSRPD